MLVPFLLASATALALPADQRPIDCGSCSEWNFPQEPFRLHGDTYYVGTRGLSALLVDTGPSGAALSVEVEVGTMFEADVHRYPGAGGQRRGVRGHSAHPERGRLRALPRHAVARERLARSALHPRPGGSGVGLGLPSPPTPNRGGVAGGGGPGQAIQTRSTTHQATAANAPPAPRAATVAQSVLAKRPTAA